MTDMSVTFPSDERLQMILLKPQTSGGGFSKTVLIDARSSAPCQQAWTRARTNPQGDYGERTRLVQAVSLYSGQAGRFLAARSVVSLCLSRCELTTSPGMLGGIGLTTIIILMPPCRIRIRLVPNTS